MRPLCCTAWACAHGVHTLPLPNLSPPPPPPPTTTTIHPHPRTTTTSTNAAQRVWDYVNDTYVHRLIQSKTDGKLVEVRGAGCAWRLRHRMSWTNLSRECTHPCLQRGQRCTPGGRDGKLLCRPAAGALARTAQPAQLQRTAAEPRAAGLRSGAPTL